MDYICTWKQFLHETLCQKKILFCHGSPDNYLSGYVYKDTDIERWSNLDYDIIFLGNTHYPFIRTVNKRVIVNVGSCGLPRDIGNMASCVIYDPEENLCQIFRLTFDSHSIITRYGDLIDESVVRCLMRKPAHINGQIGDFQ